MKINRMFFFCIAGLVLVNLTWSCESEAKKSSEQKRADIEKDIQHDLGEAKEDLNNAVKNIGEAFDGLKKKHNVGEEEPINFRDLRKALPRRMAGMKQVDTEGQTSGFLGFKVSTVEAVYEEDNSRMEAKIVDVAGVGSLVNKMADWTQFEVDKESSGGYERTTEIEGHPALEKYNERREEGEVSIIINDRFIVTVKGDNVSERQMQKAVKDLNLRKLARLGEAG